MAKNTVNNANANEISDYDYYTRMINNIIKRIIERDENSSDVYILNEISKCLAQEKGALTWLYRIRDVNDLFFNEDYIDSDIKRFIGISPDDIIQKIIMIRTDALKKVALHVSLKEVLDELEEVTWCVSESYYVY